MQNVLVILSPLEPRLLDARKAADLAVSLKAKGALRADLTSNSHFSRGGSHRGYAVDSFASAATNVATLMHQVVGASLLFDFNETLEKSYIPNAATLMGVGDVSLKFIGASDPTARDVRDVAMVLSAAIHGQAYGDVIFPHLSHNAQDALRAFKRDLMGYELDEFGRTIRLDALRARMMALSTVKAPPRSQLN